MRSNYLATWELRIGNLRVYYDVEEEPEAGEFLVTKCVEDWG